MSLRKISRPLVYLFSFANNKSVCDQELRPHVLKSERGFFKFSPVKVLTSYYYFQVRASGDAKIKKEKENGFSR